MIEETVVRTVELDTDEAVWLGDANVVLVGRHLTAEQRECALGNLQAKWRRSFLRVVA